MTIPDLLASSLQHDFAIEREIGRGGMGVVYLARDVKLDRPVAVKVLPELLALVPTVRERFLREARTAARLSHPSIVPIYRADEIAGTVFFVMAYVDGESLADRLARVGTLPPRELVRLLADVARALDYAHAHGVVHRDVKPENILIERATERALVTDFGIARLAEAAPLTATGQVLGTVHYMSPEQVSGEPVDGRSDLYSLGIVAFRALTGRLPFDAESASAVLVAHVTKRAPTVRDVAPSAPLALAELIDRCLAKEPAARPATGATLAAALEEAARTLDASPPAVAPVGAPVRATPAVISEREAQALFARAAELQARTGVQGAVAAPPPTISTSASDRRSLTSGYRFADVRDAAAEAGISERYVARAAEELGIVAARATAARVAAVHADPSRRNPWVGAPIAIGYEVQVPGEVPAAEFDVFVDAIRRRMGEAGMVGTIGRSLSWSSAAEKRRVQVSIVSRGGSTTIRVDERLGPLVGALFGGIMGGGGGGSGGIAMGVGAGALHSPVAGLAIWGTCIVASFVTARTIFRAQRNRRDGELKALIDELARLAGESGGAR